jgi:aspartyl-tRNA(Asn)/glutamyl-tRNA(Gln) amidotransferase subunit A
MSTTVTALELAKKCHNREVTAVELVQQSLDHIDSTDTEIKAYTSIQKEQALEQAEKIDKKLDQGIISSPLAGLPIGIKDNICIRDTKTTCSSKMLEHFVAPYTATAVQKLLDADLIPIGKLNLDEFAMGSSTENSAFFVTRNPRNTDYVPGGSSGGSAATVAANQVPLSLGSDTGGSIRQPAAFCGVVGMKPTYGRVSRYGLVAFASSLDQIGPFANTVKDAAQLLTLLCGHDPNDATSLQVDVPDFTTSCIADVKGLKIAVPQELFGEGIDADVKQAIQVALDKYVKAGATYDVISMSSFNAALASYYIIAPAEASANLARFDGVRYTYRNQEAETLKEMITKSRGDAFGEEVKRRIILGTFALSSGYYDAYYLKAQKARTVIKNDFKTVFSNYDVVLSPTTPTTAFKVGAVSDPLKMYLNDIATIPANMAGLPAISIPCGESNGLPIGMQLVSNVLDEATLFRAAYTFEQFK